MNNFLKTHLQPFGKDECLESRLRKHIARPRLQLAAYIQSQAKSVLSVV